MWVLPGILDSRYMSVSSLLLLLTPLLVLFGYVCIRDGSHRGVPFLVGISLGTCISQAFPGTAGGGADTLLID